MLDVPATTMTLAARSKPLIGDGSGRYRILIIGNSGTLLTRARMREKMTKVNGIFLWLLWSIMQVQER